MNHQLDTFHQELENNLIHQKSLPTSKNTTVQHLFLCKTKRTFEAMYLKVEKSTMKGLCVQKL